MPVEHDIIRTSKVNGVVVATSIEQIFADGAPSYSFGVNPGVVAQQAAIPITLAKLQSLYILASQPTSMAVNGTNAVQSVAISGGVTGGTFTLTYGGQTTAPIAWNATAATVLAALVALSSIGTSNVAVSGSAGGPWSVTFMGTLGIQVITAMIYSTASLTGGTPAIAVATTTTGVAPSQTIPLAGGIALTWSLLAGYFACPLTVDVVNLWFTNANTVSSAIAIQCPQNT